MVKIYISFIFDDFVNFLISYSNNLLEDAPCRGAAGRKSKDNSYIYEQITFYMMELQQLIKNTQQLQIGTPRMWNKHVLNK